MKFVRGARVNPFTASIWLSINPIASPLYTPLTVPQYYELGPYICLYLDTEPRQPFQSTYT